MPSDRNMNHLYPPFRKKVEHVLQELAAYSEVHFPGVRWMMVEGFRSAGYQKELYAKGRTEVPIGRRFIVTYADGIRVRSAHQSALAADIVPAKGSQILWDAPRGHWEYLGHLARKHGLEWGGDWKTFRDLSHIQWISTDAKTYSAAREWLRVKGLG